MFRLELEYSLIRLVQNITGSLVVLDREGGAVDEITDWIPEFDGLYAVDIIVKGILIWCC